MQPPQIPFVSEIVNLKEDLNGEQRAQFLNQMNIMSNRRE